MLFASAGTLSLAGIVINNSPAWTSLSDNLSGWQQMVAGARQSGLKNIPDPVSSVGSALVRPSDGSIGSTVPNRSQGALFIVETSKQLSRSYRPLVVVTGGRLTDVADAYLVDPTVADRIVVLSSLGSSNSGGGEMGIPNGEMDPWADVIVAQKLRYIQISAFYDQTADLPASLLPQLPSNAFTAWMQAKQSQIFNDVKAADQVGVVSLGIPEFVSAVSRDAQEGTATNNLPVLVSNDNGPIWLVTQINGALATARFWQMLLDATTFTSH